MKRMPKKRGRKRSKPKKQYKKDNKNEESGLKRSVLKEIVAILLVTLGVFIILALIGVAGDLGKWVLEAFRFVIGQSVYVLPIALFGVAFMLFAQEKYPLRVYNVVGIISFFICLSTILQAVLAPEGTAMDISTIGQYGGVVGYGVYSVVSPILTEGVLIFIFVMLMMTFLSMKNIFCYVNDHFYYCGGECSPQTNIGQAILTT